MYRLDPAPWLFLRAWNTDQSPKNDWAFNTAGNALSLVRKNAAPSTLTLSAAANATDWAPGKVWQVSGNLYRVGISTASISGITGLIGLAGTFTGGTLDGVFEDVTAYDPSTNPNSIAPDNAGITAIDGKLTTARLTAIDNLPSAWPTNLNLLSIDGEGRVLIGAGQTIDANIVAIDGDTGWPTVLADSCEEGVLSSAGTAQLANAPTLTAAEILADATFVTLVANALAAKNAAEANSAEIAKVPKQNENRTWTIGGGDPSVIRIGAAE